MSSKSSIEWTNSTWNPITGCTKISPGCKNCYAERMALRLKAMGQEKYKDGFNLRTHEDIITQPLEWSKPQLIFVNSMSDLFHEKVPVDFIKSVFKTMGEAHWHTFQVLTKRSRRLKELSTQLDWHPNIWMGVSVENSNFTHRISNLVQTDANIKFISLEPLLGPIEKMDIKGIDWVIVGGESGPGARPMKKEWVINIKDQCLESEVPFFFKQWGGTKKKKNGRKLNGRTWDETPVLIGAT